MKTPTAHKRASVPTRQPKASDGSGKAANSGRNGKKVIAGFFDPAVSRQLKEIGLDKDDASIQDLLREALNDFFVKHGKKPIA